jgi:hypothetical protein
VDAMAGGDPNNPARAALRDFEPMSTLVWYPSPDTRPYHRRCVLVVCAPPARASHRGPRPSPRAARCWTARMLDIFLRLVGWGREAGCRARE